jgi:hypothetical protein
MTKAEFIRSRPMAMPVSDLIAEAAEFGLTIAPGNVWTARSEMRKKGIKPSRKGPRKPGPRSDRDEEVFAFCSKFIAKHGRGPSSAEMRAGGFPFSGSSFHGVFKRLKRAGRVAFDSGNYSSMRILGASANGAAHPKPAKGKKSKGNGAALALYHPSTSGVSLESLQRLRSELVATIDNDKRKLEALDGLLTLFGNGH